MTRVTPDAYRIDVAAPTKPLSSLGPAHLHNPQKVQQICALLPRDTYGLLLRRYIEYLDSDRQQGKANALYFLVYALVIAFTIGLQVGLLVLIACSIPANTAVTSDPYVVLLRPLSLVVVYMNIVTSDVQCASVLFRVVEAVFEELAMNKPFLLIAASLATIQYAAGIGVLWLSYIVISASRTMLDTISNALVVTFVLQIDDYLGALLFSQDVHRELEKIVDPAAANNWTRRHMVVLCYALVVLFLPFLAGTILLAVSMLVVTVALGGLLLWRPAAKLVLNVAVHYSVLPTVLYGVCALRLPGVLQSGPVVFVVVGTLLVVHGMSLILPLIRHRAALNQITLPTLPTIS